MTIKKLTFCILCLVKAANLAADEDLNDKKTSISTVEENVLINKNDWNTRKCGSIYFLFPHVSVCNIVNKIYLQTSIFRELNNKWGILFNFLLSVVIEYKYMFHKKCGINISLNLNNTNYFYGKFYYSKEKQNKTEQEMNDENGHLPKKTWIYYKSLSFFSLDFSLEWIYKRQGKKIYSGSFCPISISKLLVKKGGINYDYLFWGFTLLKFEYNRCFYLNCGKIKARWSVFWDEKMNNDQLAEWSMCGIADFLSIEFGLNIIGVNDWRKKRKKNFEI